MLLLPGELFPDRHTVASCPALDLLIILFKVDRSPSILSNLCRALSSFLPLDMCPVFDLPIIVSTGAQTLSIQEHYLIHFPLCRPHRESYASGTSGTKTKMNYDLGGAQNRVDSHDYQVLCAAVHNYTATLQRGLQLGGECSFAWSWLFFVLIFFVFGLHYSHLWTILAYYLDISR